MKSSKDEMLYFSIILGESVEENANLVIRLLIRRPECLGPALRGEGEGLLRAIIDANKMSERIADRRKVSFYYITFFIQFYIFYYCILISLNILNFCMFFNEIALLFIDSISIS